MKWKLVIYLIKILKISNKVIKRSLGEECVNKMRI